MLHPVLLELFPGVTWERVIRSDVYGYWVGVFLDKEEIFAEQVDKEAYGMTRLAWEITIPGLSLVITDTRMLPALRVASSSWEGYANVLTRRSRMRVV